jgi:hypothetical protein
MVLSRAMSVMLLVAVVVIAPVVVVIAWTVRDQRSGEARWQTTAWGLAAVSFVLLSCGLWAVSLLKSGLTCEPCSVNPASPGREWTQNPEASQWELISILGSSVMVLALATVGLLRLRRPRAALLCLLAHIALSIQLVAMLNLADAANYWNWTIWPAAAGVVMLLSARDRARVVPSG